MSVRAFSDWDGKMVGRNGQLRGEEEEYVYSGVSERIPT